MISLSHYSKCLAAGLSLLLLAGGCAGSKPAAPTLAMNAKTASGTAIRTTNGAIPGVDRTSEAVGSIRDLRDALTGERSQIDKSLVALTAVTTNQGDMTPAFLQYVQSLEDLKAARQKSSTAAENMRGKARDYITGWEVELYGVEDKALREQADRRRTEVRKDYASVTDSLRTVQDAYERFATKAEDLKRFLSNDLTKAGVEAANSAGQQAITSGGELKGRIDSTVTTLDSVLGHMTPTGPAKGTGAPSSSVK